MAGQKTDPDTLDLGFDLGLDRTCPSWSRAVAPEERARDAVLEREDRMTRGLRGMSSEYGPDVELGDQRSHFVRAEPFARKRVQSPDDGAGLRLTALLSTVVSSAAQAVDLLGGVDPQKEERKCACDAGGGVERELGARRENESPALRARGLAWPAGGSRRPRRSDLPRTAG